MTPLELFVVIVCVSVMLGAFRWAITGDVWEAVEAFFLLFAILFLSFTFVVTFMYYTGL